MPEADFIIRWDDISPFQDRRKFRSLVDLFVKYEVPAVLGVIPDNQDKEIRFEDGNEARFIDELNDLQKLGWEIAQHGFRHLKHCDTGGILDINKASEFAGRSHEDQLDDIIRGKEIMSGYRFHPITFIPPWHSFDEATLTALAHSGFKVLSDGLSLYPKKANGLIQLPVLFWNAPRKIKILKWLDSIYTICLHPHLMEDIDRKELELFFRRQDINFITAKTAIRRAEKLSDPSIGRKSKEQLFSLLYHRRK